VLATLNIHLLFRPTLALAQHLAIPLVTWDQEIGQRLGAGLTVLTPPQRPAP
jgi:hypothetical protein